MAANKIVLQVDFQTGGAQAQIDDVNRKIASMGTVAQTASQQATAGLKGMTVSVDTVNDSLSQMARILTSLGIAKLGLDLIRTGDEVNRIRRGMERAGAATWFDDLSKSIGAMGGDLKTAQEGFQRLVLAGMSGEKAFKWIEGTNKLVAQLALPPEIEKGWIDWMARMQYAAPQTMKSMITGSKETMLPIEKILEDVGAKALGVRQSLIAIKDETKLIDPRGFAELMQIWVESQSKAAAVTEAHESLERRTEMLKTAFRDLGAQLQRDFGQTLINLMDMMMRLLVMFGDMLKLVGRLPQPVKDLAAAIVILAGAFYTLSGAMKTFVAFRGALALLGAAGAGAAVGGAATAAGAGAAGAAGGALFGAGTVAGAGYLTGGIAGAGAAAAAVAAAPVAVPVVTTAVVVGLVSLVMGLLVGAYRTQIWQFAKDMWATSAGSAAILGTVGIGGPITSSKPFVPGSTIGEIAGPPRNYDDEKVNAWKAMFMTDEHKVAAQIQRSRNVLDSAQEAYFKASKDGIEALNAQWDKYYRDAGKNAEAFANYQKALQYEINAYIEKGHQEALREVEKNDKEYRRAQRQSAIAMVEAIADDTNAGRQQEAAARAQAFREEMREDLAARNRLTEAQLQKDIEAIEITNKIRQAKFLTADEQIAALRADAHLKEISDAASTAEQIAHHRIQTEKETNKAILDERRKDADQAMQDELLRINSMRDLMVQHAQLVEPQTFGQRLGQTGTVGSIEVRAIENAAASQLKALEERKAALDDSLRRAQQAEAVGFLTGRGVTTTDAQFKQRQDEINKDFERDRLNLAYQTDVEIQKNRLDLWKRTNEIVIDEQKRVFTTFKDAAGQVFDAIFDKSRSFFASLGDLLKRAALGIAKDFVTNRVAAGLSDIFGYGKPKLQGRFPLGEDVLFGGIGLPPGLQLGEPPKIETVTQVIQYARITVISGAISGGGGGPIGEAARMVGGSEGGADRMIEEALPAYVNPPFSPAQLPAIFGPTTPPFMPPTGPTGSLARLGGLFGIGGPGGTSISSVLTSKGVQGISAMVGMGLLSSGLKRGGAGGAAQSVLGGAGLGYGLSGALGVSPLWGAVTGASIGLFAAGVKQGGVAGLAMTTGGGALAGYQFGGPIGALIGAGVGLITGVAGLFRTTPDEQVRKLVMQTYGVNIREKSVRDQIVQIAQSNYGGNIRLAVFSPEVQELVRLYSLSYGIGSAMLPRPMYSATIQQSTAGGLQLQPVYSGGQVVANPYSGTTTTQFNTATSGSVFMQLNPDLAMRLFSGQVVKVMGDNPGAVASANTVAATSGTSRTAQASALLEPMTVMR